MTQVASKDMAAKIAVMQEKKRKAIMIEASNEKKRTELGSRGHWCPGGSTPGSVLGYTTGGW